MTDTTTPPLGAGTERVRFGSNAGQSMTRREGVLKLTGTATFTADNQPDGLLYAAVASAGIARGRVAALDTAAALAHPGVVHVMTPENRPALSEDPDENDVRFTWKLDVLQNDQVRYAGQPIALILAETVEAAAEGVRLLAPRYEAAPTRMGFDGGVAIEAPFTGLGSPPTFTMGDLEAARAATRETVETDTETPLQYHNAMEPHAIVAHWADGRLNVDMPAQGLAVMRAAIARFIGIAPEDVTIRSPYIGGGFGSKAALNGIHLLAILAARALDRPVKLVLRREQMFGPVQHRGATRQTVRLGLGADGRLTSIEHSSRSTTSSFDMFLEGAANASRNLYAAEAIKVGHTGVRIDTGTPGAMRAPGEATGSAALECAIDMAAEQSGIDPMEFRLRNYAETDPATGKPFSSKALRQCYAQGADAFGWAGRPLAPRQMHDEAGRLLGWGMGTAIFPAYLAPAEAKATILADGTARMEAAASDMGQGAWTSLAQIAADGLGLDIDQVDFRAGISDLPNAGMAGGSAHTASAGSAIFDAGAEAVRQLAEIAVADPASPLFGAGNEGVIAREGALERQDDPTRRDLYADILRRAGLERLEGNGKSSRPPAAADRACYAHGAVFAEVLVDPDLYQIRVTRMVGAFAAGRIVNPRLAQSQLLGGMVWGLSFALHEEGVHDPRTGRPVNGDLAGYHVPVNADAPHIEALTVDEPDPYVNPLGIKGVGELGITGSVGAIANAVWHATGIRVRRFPIHISDLLAADRARAMSAE